MGTYFERTDSWSCTQSFWFTMLGGAQISAFLRSIPGDLDPGVLWTISKKYSPTESSQALKKLLGIRSHVLKYIVSRERGLEVIDPTSSNPHHRNRRCKLSSQPELTYQQRLPSIPLTRIIPKTKIQVMSSTGHHASLIFSFQITPKGKNPPDKFGVFFLHHYLREHIYSI